MLSVVFNFAMEMIGKKVRSISNAVIPVEHRWLSHNKAQFWLPTLHNVHEMIDVESYGQIWLSQELFDLVILVRFCGSTDCCDVNKRRLHLHSEKAVAS